MPVRPLSAWRARSDVAAKAARPLLLTAVAIALAWRAATLSLTYDEAYAWLSYGRGSFGDVLDGFSAGHHGLFVWLQWVAVRLTGPTEFGLRLPTVVAAWAYLWVAGRLGSVLAETEPRRTLVTAALALNPFLLDFLVAARGYGLATSALVLALWWAGRSSDREAMGVGLLPVGAALGVAATANLAFLPPAMALGLLVAVESGRAAHRGRVRDATRAALLVALPAAAVAAVVMGPALRHARRDHFFYGAQSLSETAASLVEASLRYAPDARWALPAWLVAPLANVAAPLLVAAAAVWTVSRLRRGGPAATAEHEPAGRVRFLAAGTLALTVAGLAAGHLVTGLPLPLERTGLYFLPLAVVVLAGIAARGAATSAWQRAVGATATCTLAALTLAFAAQFPTNFLRTWKFDAGSRDVFRVVASWPCPVDRPRTLGSTRWLYEPALEFYRTVTAAAHVLPLPIDGTGPDPETTDFSVVPGHAVPTELPASHVRVYAHPVSGAEVWARRDLAGCTSP